MATRRENDESTGESKPRRQTRKPAQTYTRAAPRYRDGDEGLVVYADEQKCEGGYLARKRCVKDARKEYAKKNRVLYTTECEMLPTWIERKKCYRKKNRGL